MSEGTRAVVVGHGEVPTALVAAVEAIYGDIEGAITPLSNQGLGPDAIRDRLDAILGDGPALVFTDLRDGSCGLAARRACIDRTERRLVTGANLPMLLDFMINRATPLDALVARLVDRGRGAIDTG